MKKGFFFFEKKKQKTFANFVQQWVQKGQSGAALTDKSFLVLFFKKELLAFAVAMHAP